jgi:hypothetical protein
VHVGVRVVCVVLCGGSVCFGTFVWNGWAVVVVLVLAVTEMEMEM